MEGFTRAAAALAATGTPAMDDVLRIAEENGIELLGRCPRSAGQPARSAFVDPAGRCGIPLRLRDLGGIREHRVSRPWSG